MKPKEMEELYYRACDAKGFTGSDGQLKIWRQILGRFEKSDLEEAILAYYEKETGFPMPAELKPLAANAQRRRESIEQGERSKVFVHMTCPTCGDHSSGAFTPERVRRPFYCRSIYGPVGSNTILDHGTICGGSMEVKVLDNIPVSADK